MNRRDFLLGLPVLVPLPAAVKRRKHKPKLESPRGAEQSFSLRRVKGGQLVTAKSVQVLLPSGFVITDIHKSGNNLVISWQQGIAPFWVQGRASLVSGAWSNVDRPTALRTITVPMNGPQQFYRVQERVPLLSLTPIPGAAQLIWSIPII